MSTCSTILTNEGRYFYFDEPERHQYTIEEIGHALANICRYTGHVRSFYSVAQHSVLVSEVVPRKHAMAALLHDASEAYLGDVSSPLKRMLPDYKAIEKRVERAICRHFGLDYPMDPCIKAADLCLLYTEKRDLMKPGSPFEDRMHWAPIEGVREPLAQTITPWGPDTAYRHFVNRYYDLMLGSPPGVMTWPDL